MQFAIGHDSGGDLVRRAAGPLSGHMAKSRDDAAACQLCSREEPLGAIAAMSVTPNAGRQINRGRGMNRR